MREDGGGSTSALTGPSDGSEVDGVNNPGMIFDQHHKVC